MRSSRRWRKPVSSGGWRRSLCSQSVTSSMVPVFACLAALCENAHQLKMYLGRKPYIVSQSVCVWTSEVHVHFGYGTTTEVHLSHKRTPRHQRVELCCTCDWRHI